MAIATRTEVKTLLQITDTTKDTIIDALLPVITSEIIDYCGSHFDYPALQIDGDEYLGGITISVTALTKTIADSDNDMPFSAGQNIYISGSRFIDGHYTIATAGTGSITTVEDLVDETVGADISIRLVKFPAALKLIFAEYISTKINNREIGVSNENISGAIGTSYFEDGAGMPSGIKKALAKYKVIGVI